jgi:hypothetical protein
MYVFIGMTGGGRVNSPFFGVFGTLEGRWFTDKTEKRGKN